MRLRVACHKYALVPTIVDHADCMHWGGRDMTTVGTPSHDSRGEAPYPQTTHVYQCYCLHDHTRALLMRP